MNSRFGLVAGLGLAFVVGGPSVGVLMSSSAPSLVAWASADDNTKQNMIAFFMETGCPDGWDVYEPAQGRLLLGVTDSTKFTIGSTGGGDPLTDQENPTHTHQYSTLVDAGSKGLAASSGSNKQGSSPGDKNVPYEPPGITGASTSNTPLIQLTVCQKTAAPSVPSAPDPYPMGALAFFDSATCPVGNDTNSPDWQAAPLGQDDLGYFVVPFFDPPASTLAALVGTGMAPGEDRAHNHAFASSIKLTAVEYVGLWEKGGRTVATSGTKNFSNYNVPTDLGLPYLTLQLCQRATFTMNENPPPNVPKYVVSFFTTQTCPTGWKMTQTTTGRYLVGLPAGGTPGASFGGIGGLPLDPSESAPTPVVAHDHTFSGQVKTGSKGVELASGCCADGAGGAGTYDYSGTTDPSPTTTSHSANLPYLGVIQCQPCIDGDDPDQSCQTSQ